MSPAVTLEASEAGQAILAAADDLFYNRGVAAVTMSDIRDRSHVSLRRLYSEYPSKSDLVSAWLRHRHHEWMTHFVGRVEDHIQDGDAPVDAVFVAIEAWMTATGFRGCGFINTYAEASALTEEQRVIIRSHKSALASYLTTLIPEGEAVAVIVDGAIVQAAIFGTAAPIHHAHHAAAVLARPEAAA